MKLKVLTLGFDASTGRFDESQLEAFMEDPDRPREVLDVSEHFFVHDRHPTWALLISYRDVPRPGDGKARERRKDYRADLDEPSKVLFDELRSWRATACKREGLPPYLICTNRQVADIARSRPSSLAKLQEINGLGEAKVSRWGEEILALVGSTTEPQPTKAEPSEEEPSEEEPTGG